VSAVVFGWGAEDCRTGASDHLNVYQCAVKVECSQCWGASKLALRQERVSRSDESDEMRLSLSLMRERRVCTRLEVGRNTRGCAATGRWQRDPNSRGHVERGGTTQVAMRGGGGQSLAEPGESAVHGR
jgi:hypothetical protein